MNKKRKNIIKNNEISQIYSFKLGGYLQKVLIEAKFKKTGKTNLILEDSNGNKEIYEIDIKNNDFDINKKEPNKESSQWKTENVKIKKRIATNYNFLYRDFFVFDVEK